MIRTETVSLINPEEQDMLTMNALLGSIDDSMAELEQARRMKADAEVFTKITGKVVHTYAAARESFSDDLGRLYAVFEAMEARVSAMGCNHDHFLQSSLDIGNEHTGQPNNLHLHSSDRRRKHACRIKEPGNMKEKDKKKKDKKAKRLSGWALLGIAQKTI